MRRPVVYIALFFMGMILILDAFFHVKLYDEGKLPGHEGEKVRVSGTLLSAREKSEKHLQLTVQVQSFSEARGAAVETSESQAAGGGGEASKNQKAGEIGETVLESDERLIVDLYAPYGSQTPFMQGKARPDPGREISVAGELFLPAEHRNPGTFDYRKHLMTQKIYVTMKGEPDSLKAGPVKDHVRFFASRLRSRFISSMEEYTDEDTAAMAQAMLFGDRSGLDEDEYERFQKNGTAHILAVSGLHIGAVYAFLSFLWRGRKRGAFTAFVASFLVFYCFLADFSPSVVRAVIMIILHLIAQLLYRRYDIMSAAALTAIIVLFADPMQIYNTGFQMSFLAVTVISALTPFTEKGLKGNILFMLLFQMVMLPYTAFVFNYVSLAAFLINPLVIMLAGVMVPAGVFTMVMINILPTAAGEAGCRFFSLCTDALTGINEAAYRPGYLTFDAASPKVLAVWIFYAGFFILASELVLIMRLRKKWSSLLCILAAAAVISIGAAGAADEGFSDADVIFVDVGQGDCMHMRIGGESNVITGGSRYNVLIDGGGKADYDVGKKVLKPYLLKNGTSVIDLAIVTHLHTDHYDGIRSICRQGMVRKLCVYEGYKVAEDEILRECGLEKEDIIYVTAGSRLRVGDAEFRILAPPARSREEYERLAADEEDENRKSLLIKGTYKGASLMMTGDIGFDREDQVMGEQSAASKAESALRCDILKVGHHGSRYSTGDLFLDTVDPEIAVIQVGKNNYGHPSKDVLEKLRARSIPVCRNDEQGAIGLELKNGEVTRVHTVLPVQ